MASSAMVLLKDTNAGDESCKDNAQGPKWSESNLNYLYQLDVYTAVRPGCGTHSEVLVKLEGSASSTDWLSLTNSRLSEAEKATFPTGSKRQYMIASKCVIGIPERVNFKLLTCPSDSSKYDWTVGHVILTELYSQSQWMVRVNQTLYADTCDDSVYSFDDLVTGTQSTVSSAFRVNLARGFGRIHLWAMWNKNETNLGVFTTLVLLINIILGILTVNSITILLKAYEQDVSKIYISATQIRYLALGYCGIVFGIWSLEWLLRFLQPKDIVNHIEFTKWMSSTNYQKKYPLQSFKYFTCQSDHVKDWLTIKPHSYSSYDKLGSNKHQETNGSLNKVSSDNGTSGCSRKNSVPQTAVPSIQAPSKDEEMLTCTQSAQKTGDFELVKPGKNEELLLTCTEPAQKTSGFELVKPEMLCSTNALYSHVASLQRMCTTVVTKALQLIKSSMKLSSSAKPTSAKINWSLIKQDMEEIRAVAVELQALVREDLVYHSFCRSGNKNAHNNMRDGAARKNKRDAGTQTEDDEWIFITDSSDAGSDSHSLESVHWKESQQSAKSLADKLTTPAKNECAIYVGTTKKNPQDSEKSGSTVRKYVINKNAIDNDLVNSNSINESPSSHSIINIENDGNGDMIGANQGSDTCITVNDCDQPEPCVHDGTMASQTKISPMIAGLPDNDSNFTDITRINMEEAPEVCFSTNSLHADEEKPASDSFTLNSNKPGRAIETIVFFLEGKWSHYLNDVAVKNTSMASRSVLLLLLLLAGVLGGFCVAKCAEVGWAVYYKVVVYWAIAILGHILLLEPIKSLLSVAYTTYIAKELVRW